MSIYLQLFWVFSKIGLFGFGGGMAMLPIIYQSAKHFSLMDEEEFTNLIGISQITPGPLAVNAATYVGYNGAGLLGAITATLGVALPSFLMVIVVCYFVNKFKESSIVEGAFVGIRPVTCGLIAAAAILIGESTLADLDPVPMGICAATFLLALRFRVSPIWLMLGSGVIGAILCG